MTVMARLVVIAATSLSLACSLFDPRAETGAGRAVPGSSCPLVVEIDNLGIDPLQVSWVEVDTKMSFSIGEAGLGETVLPVPEYVRARMPKYRGNWNVQRLPNGQSQRQRPNYRLHTRCADPYLPAASLAQF